MNPAIRSFALAALAPWTVPCTLSVAGEAPRDPGLVTVTGTASEDVFADEATVVVSVTSQRHAAWQAEEGARREREVVVAIAAKYPETLVSEGDAELRPRGRSGPNGGGSDFSYTETMTLRVGNVDKVAALVGELADKGVGVVGTCFGIAGERARMATLRGAALSDARTKARAEAEAIGRTLGEVVSIGPDVTPGPDSCRPSGPDRDFVQTRAGVRTLSASVTATWEVVRDPSKP